MSAPIALGRPLSPSPLNERTWNGSVLTAPTTPGNRLPVVDKSKVDPQTLKAAEGMEAMFLDYLMKVMRQSVPKNSMDLENGATEIYRSMLDSETAQRAARAGGVGLADQIVAYLEAQRYNLPRGQAVPVADQRQVPSVDPAREGRSTGGTNEGHTDR